VKKYLLNDVDINLRLYPSRPEFYLMCKNPGLGCRFEILEAIYRVCRIKVTSAVLIAHSQALGTSSAKYPFQRSYVKILTMPGGHMTFVADNVFSGYAPTRLVVGLTEAVSASGGYQKNPFNFGRFSLVSINLYIDGQSTPEKALPISEGAYITSYNDLFYSTGKWNEDVGIDLSRGDYAQGHSIYAFQIDAYANDEYLSLLRAANVRLELQFSKAAINAIAVVCYATFPGLLEVDKSRGVFIHSSG
jgi:hypothetical protein